MSRTRNRQNLVGSVVSTKMKDTVNVLVTRVISQPIYKKSKKTQKISCSCFNEFRPKMAI